MSAPARAQVDHDFDTDPGTEIVYFSDAHGEMEGDDNLSWLRVFGDGRVRIHHASGMKRAGDFELRLSQAEMRSLLRALAGGRLVEFDEGVTRSQKRASEATRRGGPKELFGSSDPSTITLELHLLRYVPEGEAERRNVSKRIQWRGLRADARRHPSVTAIQDLAAAERRLGALMRRGDLEPVPAGAP